MREPAGLISAFTYMKIMKTCPPGCPKDPQKPPKPQTTPARAGTGQVRAGGHPSGDLPDPALSLRRGQVPATRAGTPPKQLHTATNTPQNRYTQPPKRQRLLSKPRTHATLTKHSRRGRLRGREFNGNKINAPPLRERGGALVVGR